MVTKNYCNDLIIEFKLFFRMMNLLDHKMVKQVMMMTVRKITNMIKQANLER